MPYFKHEETEACHHGAAHSGSSLAPQMRLFQLRPMELSATMELVSVLFSAEATGHMGQLSPSNMMEHNFFILSILNSFQLNLNCHMCLSSG